MALNFFIKYKCERSKCNYPVVTLYYKKLYMFFLYNSTNYVPFPLAFYSPVTNKHISILMFSGLGVSHDALPKTRLQ